MTSKKDRCTKDGCQRRRSFGMPGTRKAIFCSHHATEGMVGVIHKQCEEPGCERQPNYGLKGSRNAHFCSRHAKKDMVDVRHKRCIREGCDKQASYGEKGKGAKGAVYCSVHTDETMVYLKKKRAPVYAMPGSTPPLYCSYHSKPGMVDLNADPASNTCEMKSCVGRRNYGKKGSKRAMFCARHATEGMVDLTARRCAHKDCNSLPTRGVTGTNMPMFCPAHSNGGMVDVPELVCAEDNCTRYPTHGAAGRRGVLYCSRHVKEGMGKIKRYARRKRCAAEECARFSSHGMEGDSTATFCETHAQDGMVDLEAKAATCAETYCEKLPTHGMRGGTVAFYCGDHATETMVHVTHGGMESYDEGYREGNEPARPGSSGVVGDSWAPVAACSTAALPSPPPASTGGSLLPLAAAPGPCPPRQDPTNSSSSNGADGIALDGMAVEQAGVAMAESGDRREDDVGSDDEEPVITVDDNAPPLSMDVDRSRGYPFFQMAGNVGGSAIPPQFTPTSWVEASIPSTATDYAVSSPTTLAVAQNGLQSSSSLSSRQQLASTVWAATITPCVESDGRPVAKRARVDTPTSEFTGDHISHYAIATGPSGSTRAAGVPGPGIGVLPGILSDVSSAEI